MSVFLKVKDHSVSGEEFELIYDPELDLLKTHPQPKNLSIYYEDDNYISHTDAKRNLFEKCYHMVRKITLKQKLKLISKQTSSEKRLLDVGCGTGDFLKYALDNGWNVKGIEPNESARAIANSKVNNLVYDGSEVSLLEESSFDVITLWHVLEHLPNLEGQIKKIQLLLKPNGVLYIAVPNYKSYDAKHYKSFWAAYDVPRHLWHFSQEAIRKIFQKHKMTISYSKPMWFDAFYVSLISEKNKTGRSNILKAFFIAFLSNTLSLFTKECSSLIYVIKKQENTQ